MTEMEMFESDLDDSHVDVGVCEEDEAMFASDDGDGSALPTLGRKRTKEAKIPLVACNVCKRSYFVLEAYIKHLKMHLVEELFSSAPVYEDILGHCRLEATKVLDGIRTSRYTAGLAKEVKKIAEFLSTVPQEELWKFVDAVTEEIYQCIPQLSTMSLPSFDNLYTQNSNRFLNDTNKCSDLQCIVQNLLPFKVDGNVLKWFVARFCSETFTSAGVFFLNYISAPLKSLCSGSSRCDNRDDLESEDFQQSVYFIGGSCIKSIFRLGRSAENCERWSSIFDCVKSRLLAGDLVNAPSENVTAWTESKDRGGLLYISESVWSYLMVLSGILKEVEEQDGSVKHELVYNRMKEDAVVMSMWKDIVGDSLSEENSDFLMTQLCQFYVNAWGRGVAWRRLNALPRRSMGKVPLRSTLAR